MTALSYLRFSILTSFNQPLGFRSSTMVGVLLSRTSVSSQPFAVTAIIFVVPLSAFNQVLDESEYSFVLETSFIAHRYHRSLREQTGESQSLVTQVEPDEIG